MLLPVVITLSGVACILGPTALFQLIAGFFRRSLPGG